ncbi:cysteine proteinase, partial [Phlegmacium glaucopus]
MQESNTIKSIGHRTNLHRLLCLRVRSLPLGVPHLSKCLQAMIKNFKIMQQLEVVMLDKEVAGERAEMAGAQLKELKEKCKCMTKAGSHGREMGHKKLVKNIVNGYPIYNNKMTRTDVSIVYSCKLMKNVSPTDVHRVTQIFDNPQFFVGGAADSNDIIQGALGDWWFLSALATVSRAPGLVEKFCVARDEKVGVYGFIFSRDNAWITVMIDDGVSTVLQSKDILEPEQFWDDELSRANKDRLFGCSFNNLDSTRIGGYMIENHAYSVLRAVPVPPLPVVWSYGDVTFTFSPPGHSTTVIVLSQLDPRYYRDVAGLASWTMDFTLVKEGQKEPIAESGHLDFYLRSVHLEVNLEAGNYIVYVHSRIKKKRKKGVSQNLL